jgi:hypothetical protein
VDWRTLPRIEAMALPLSRSAFFGMLPGAAILAALMPARVRGTGVSGEPKHPEPRPGVDATNVLTAEALEDAPHAVPVFDGIREIPHIADGILCYCGCADRPGFRSLLSCFEEAGMARHCAICLGEGRLAHRRFKEGQSLEQIRRAIDARYGPRGARMRRAAIPA